MPEVLQGWAAAHGNFTEMQLVPLMAGAALRAVVARSIGSQFYADVLIGVVLGLAQILLLWQLLCASVRVSRHIFGICATAPTAVLSLVGALALGVLLWATYMLSAIEFPTEHAALAATFATLLGVVADAVMRVGGLFLRSAPGG